MQSWLKKGAKKAYVASSFWTLGGIHNYITPILTEAGPSVTRELRGVSLRNSRFAGRCLPSSALPSNGRDRNHQLSSYVIVYLYRAQIWGKVNTLRPHRNVVRLAVQNASIATSLRGLRSWCPAGLPPRPAQDALETYSEIRDSRRVARTPEKAFESCQQAIFTKGWFLGNTCFVIFLSLSVSW
jgi:hypothetical protein